MTENEVLDADKIGLKSELEFLRALADILCPPDGVSPPDVKRAMMAISTMRMALSRAPRAEVGAPITNIRGTCSCGWPSKPCQRTQTDCGFIQPTGGDMNRERKDG